MAPELSTVKVRPPLVLAAVIDNVCMVPAATVVVTFVVDLNPLSPNIAALTVSDGELEKNAWAAV
jgi:hypothetical protein